MSILNSFVGDFLASADGFIRAVSKSGFGAMLEAVDKTARSASALAILFLICNQFLQLQYIELGRFLRLFIKLSLIASIGLKWENFEKATYAVQGGMDYIAGKLLTMTSPTSADSVAGAIDNMINTLSNTFEKSGHHLTWFAGALFSIVTTLLLSILGCAGGMIIVYSKVMIGVYICIAPLFIACFIFEVTKDYFFRWVQGAITYLLYPIVTACIIGMICNVITVYFEKIKKNPIHTIVDVIPYIAVTIIMIYTILSIRTIVAGLSGMIQHVSPKELFESFTKYNPMNPLLNTLKTLMDFFSKKGQDPEPISPKTDTSQTPKTFQGEPSKMQNRSDRILKEKSSDIIR